MSSYTPFDYTRPDPLTDNGLEAFNATRANLLAVRDAVVLGIMPGWDEATAGGDPGQPAEITHSRGDERLRIQLTWEEQRPTQAVYHYSLDAGATWLDIGTETITYDSAGAVQTVTWS